MKPNQPPTQTTRPRGGRVLTPPGRKLGNWLQGYRHYTADSEAAPLFHIWGGLGAISAVIGKQVSMHMGKFSYLTNLYTVLVGPAGSKKTTAMLTARNLVKQVPGIHTAPNIANPESILKRMCKIDDPMHQSISIYSLELGTLLSEGPQQRHMLDFLCDIFDGIPDYEKETIGRGVENLTNPWLAFQSCTTPEWLQNSLSSHSVEGGFVSRTLWIYSDERRLTNPWPEETAEQRKLREWLINDLTHISALQGDFKASPEAKEFYSAWYKDPTRFPKTHEQRLGGYYERKSIHVIKLAMILSLAENDSLCIERRDIESALALLAEIEPDMHRAFIGVGKNIHSTDTERIYRQIKDASPQGLPYGRILSANYHANNQDEIDRMLRGLQAMGKITFQQGVWRVK